MRGFVYIVVWLVFWGSSVFAAPGNTGVSAASVQAYLKANPQAAQQLAGAIKQNPDMAKQMQSQLASNPQAAQQLLSALKANPDLLNQMANASSSSPASTATTTDTSSSTSGSSPTIYSASDLQNYLNQNSQAAQQYSSMLQSYPNSVNYITQKLQGNPSAMASFAQSYLSDPSKPNQPQDVELAFIAATVQANPSLEQQLAQNATSSSSSSTTTSSTSSSSQDPSPQESQSDRAFQAMLQSAFPLSPDQIQTMHNLLDQTQLAASAAPYVAPPRPVSSSMIVNLAPGATPPVIRLSEGFVSSLVFIDSTGAPWPVLAYDLGDPNAFNITWDKKDNTLMIQARSAHNYGNLAVKLKGLDTPVMLTLIPGQPVVDYRVDLRLQGLGPNAKPMAQGDGLPSQATPVLLSVLDGVPPKGSKRLVVNGGDAQAWLQGNTLYLRTRFNVLSPAWVAKMSSADGTNAYQMQKTPMVLVSRYGKSTSLKIEGF